MTPKFARWRALGAASAALLALAGCAPPPAAPAPARPDVLRAALAHADTLREESVAPGVRHIYAWDAAGPWAIHVIEAALGPCGPRIAARKPGPDLAARATTSALAADAVAGVNADFFALPGGTPVGPHVQAGSVLAGPAARPTVFAWSADGPWIGASVLQGHVRSAGDSLPVLQVNRAPPATDTGAGVYLFTHWYGGEAPADSAGVAVRLDRPSEVDGTRRAVVRARSVPATPLALDSAAVVLLGRGEAARRLLELAPGDTLAWAVALLPAGGGAAAIEAVGGFPLLVQNDTLARSAIAATNPSFGEARHPRTAVGLTADRGRLLLVVVDGRQPPYSAGMSLTELGDLMLRLGAASALNLDGGGSSAAVVRGSLVNRPSDRGIERAVGNALVLLPGGC
jgi:hypothetical protein